MEFSLVEEDHMHGEEEDEIMCKQAGIKKVVIASISGVPKFSIFKIRGVSKDKGSQYLLMVGLPIFSLMLH
jgi:hypothetical protein